MLLWLCTYIPGYAQSEKLASLEKGKSSAGPTQLPSDGDWKAIADVIERESPEPKDTARPRGALSKAELESLSRSARDFYTKHPTDPRAGKARKIELQALLRQQSLESSDRPETIKKLRDYLEDSTVPAEERFDVSALAKELGLQRLPTMNRTVVRREREARARQLIAEFPEDRRGYGYLLAVAKAKGGEEAKRLATELLGSPAPAVLKEEAQRLIDRLEMEGKPLVLNVPGLDLSKLKRKPVVVYSWSMKQPAHLNTILKLAKREGVVFVGINLDADRAVAERTVNLMQIPGQHLYETEGMSGPIARQLHLTMRSSIMLVDGTGKVVSVHAHEDPESKLAELLGKGGRP